MNCQTMKGIGMLLAAGAALMLVLGGCASSPPPANVQTVQCATKKIEWDVAPEAEIANFNCEVGKKGMDPALIVSMDLKNASDQARRFKVHVFLEDMDKASGHLVPRKGKPPVVAPGAVAKVKIPFIKTDKMSSHMSVVVKAMSD